MPRADISVYDALLNAIDDTGTELYITETIPGNRAAAISNALHSAPVVRTPGKAISGAAGIGSASGDRRYTDGVYNNVTLDNISGSQTPTYLAICSGTLLLAIADISGGTALTNGTVVDLSTWDTIVNAVI